MLSSSDRAPRYRFPNAVVGHAVYRYHRFTLNYRDVQERLSWAERHPEGACPLFTRGILVSHETIHVCLGLNGTSWAERTP